MTSLWKNPFIYLAVLTLAVGLITLVSATTSFSSPSGGRQPKIEVVAESHDFGKIVDGDIVEHTFKFRNAGDDTLIIYDVRATCGCTAALLSQKRLAPGASGEVKTTFNSRGKIGHIEKAVYLNSNDPKKGTVFLKLIADVVASAHGEKAHEMMMTGNYFEGQCANCHVEPASGKLGQPLFAAVCEMCHGPAGSGGVAKISLKEIAGTRSPDYLKDRIADGSPANIMMRGFSKKHGGPLDDSQIASLVSYLRDLR